MVAEIINGKSLALTVKQNLKEKISRLKTKPTLAVIISGNDTASQIYVKNKETACAQTGITTQTYHLPSTIKEQDLLSLIKRLNQTPEINGILVQLPLPEHIDTQKVLCAILPEKDVDGFHPLNTGLMVQKSPDALVPCTPQGIIELLLSVKKDLSGLTAVVIGRSQIVGLPVARLLINQNCTTTIAHSKTQNLPTLCRTADILVSAIGKPEFITGEYIKPNAIVIDVGINRTSQGLKGDVKFSDALRTASFITPVPGGVGPMTIAMLLKNTYQAYLKQNHS